MAYSMSYHRLESYILAHCTYTELETDNFVRHSPKYLVTIHYRPRGQKMALLFYQKWRKWIAVVTVSASQ